MYNVIMHMTKYFMVFQL